MLSLDDGTRQGRNDNAWRSEKDNDKRVLANQLLASQTVSTPGQYTGRSVIAGPTPNIGKSVPERS